MKVLKLLPLIVVPWLADLRAPAGQDGPIASGKSQPGDAGSAAQGKVASATVVNVSASIVTPDRKPAAKAKVALVELGARVGIRNGDFDEKQTRCPRESTDQAGRFHFTTEARDFWLVVVHPSGDAQVECSPDSIPKTITLTRWARVEGTYRVARKPKPGVDINIRWQQNLMFGPRAAHLYVTNRQTTDANGRFVFERVMPGKGRIGSVLPENPGDLPEMASACTREASFLSGKTTHLEFGASGRPVIGQLKRPRAAPQLPWSQAYINVRPAGRLRGDELAFTATAATNGEFWVDDVPMGKYSLSVWFGRVGAGRLLGHLFQVPSINEKLWQKPVDLGVLQLTADPIRVGKPLK
jgi:hypothetical protein